MFAFLQFVVINSLLFNSPFEAFAAESGSAFLQIDPAAKPAAMGGAFTATTGDIDALAYNPAGIAGINRWEASFTHAEWLVDTRYDYLGYGHTTRLGTFGLSAIRMSYGDLEGRSVSRQQTANFSAYDSAYTLAYANTIGDYASLGGAVKILERKIDSDRASSYAMDFGAVRRLTGTPAQVGASVLNIGPGTRFIDQTDPLPLTLTVGTLYRGSARWQANIDLRHLPHDKVTTALGGFEFKPVSILALRAGYQVPFKSTGHEEAWDIDNIRGGIGLQITRLYLDYALAPMGDLGLTHRFTVSFRFGLPKNLLSTDVEK